MAIAILIGLIDNKEEETTELEKEAAFTQLSSDEDFNAQQVKTTETDIGEELGLTQSPMQYVVIDHTNIYLWEQPTTSAEFLKREDGSNCYPVKGERYKTFGETVDYYLIDFHGKRVWVEKQYAHIETEMVQGQSVQLKTQSDIIEENLTITQNAIHQVIDEVNVEDELEPIDVEDFSKQIIYDIVDIEPIFPGGEVKLMEYISQNIRLPQEALERGIHGRVFVAFIVEPNGSISNVKVLRGIGNGYDEEAVRVVETMPKWIPGEKHGKPVRVAVTIPVTYR